MTETMDQTIYSLKVGDDGRTYIDPPVIMETAHSDTLAFTFNESGFRLSLIKLSMPDDEGGRVLTINKRDAHFVQVCETEAEIIFRLVPKK